MNSRKTRLAILALVLTPLVPAAAHAAGLLKPADGGPPLAIDSHEVRVEITDGIAVTEVVQVFRNDSPQPLEAVYSFPLPSAASLSGFTMWIDGREMDGEVIEKARARRIYEEIAHPAIPSQQTADRIGFNTLRKDPGLIEQVSYREFQATVFPVPARGTQRIRLLYYQYLTPDRDVVTYSYPMETRAVEDSRSRGVFNLEVTLRSSVPIADCVFPGAAEDRLISEASGDRRVVARMDRTDGDLDRDFVMAYRLGRATAGADLVSWKGPGEDGYFMLLATSPAAAVASAPRPVDYTFVVDVSGSMRRQRRLDIAGQAIARFLESCEKSDRFNLIAFNVRPQAFSPQALPNDAASREAMLKFLSGFTGVGGTDLYPALDLAYAQASPGRAQAFVVMTDGGLNDLDEDHGRFLRLAGGHDATIFGLALGNDANLPLLDALAGVTGGFVAQVSTQDDLEVRGLLLRDKMRQDPLRSLSLQVDGPIEIAEVTPARIPDLYPGTQVAVLGRYRGEGEAVFRLLGRRGGETEVLQTRAVLRGNGSLYPEIRRMWAERRVFDLMQARRAGRLPENVRQTVVDLGERYVIVTPETSFIVLENDQMFRDRGIARRSRALLEGEARAREERAQRADAAPIGPQQQPPRMGESFGGAVDPAVLILIAIAALAPWAWRRAA